MPHRTTFAIATLRTTVVVGMIGASMLMESAGLRGAFTGVYLLWTYAIALELHGLLPERFYELWADFEYNLTILFLALVVDGFMSGVEWAGRGLGVDALWEPLAPVLDPFLSFFGILIVGAILVSGVRMVRHVLSAIESIEAGAARKVSVGLTVINILLCPIYILLVHIRARRALLATS